MDHFKIIVVSELLAESVASALIKRSAWFALTPFPDDEWEFEVKKENEDVVFKICEESRN